MGRLTLEEVNNAYVDVLKEIGNVGAGNATTAIASMLGIRIDMSVPRWRYWKCRIWDRQSVRRKRLS